MKAIDTTTIIYDECGNHRVGITMGGRPFLIDRSDERSFLDLDSPVVIKQNDEHGWEERIALPLTNGHVAGTTVATLLFLVARFGPLEIRAIETDGTEHTYKLGVLR